MSKLKMRDVESRLTWHWPGYFRVLKYALCPTSDDWAAERLIALRDFNADIGDYPTSRAMTTSYRNERWGARCLVTVRDDLTPAEVVGSLAHEAYHVACVVAEQMHDRDASEEFMAYTMTEVFERLVTDYEARRGKLLARGAK